MKKYIKLIVFAVIFSASYADLKLELTQGLANKDTVALVGFEIPKDPDNKIKSQLIADLSLSGEFKVIDLGKNMPGAIAKAKKLGAKYLVSAEISKAIIAKYYNLEMKFYKIGREADLVDISTYNFKISDLVTFVHVLDDEVYNKVTGLKGIFTTRIAYVMSKSKVGMHELYNLEVSDFDGGRSQTIVSSNKPIVAPSWSHDGKKIAYVSFEDNMPVVFVQELFSGKRESVTEPCGIDNSPSFSPDNKSLAVVLTTSGVPKIYTLDLATKIVSPIQSTAYDIDAEPSFSPDGNFIYFTSNRAGFPNIYKYDLELETTDRITFSGDYNASGRVSASGQYLVYLHREGGLFSLNTLNLSNGKSRVIASDGFERMPVIAPNSNVIAYASQYASRSILGFVSIDGKIKWRLPALYGNVSEPAWSPFIDKRQDFLVNYSINEVVNDI